MLTTSVFLALFALFICCNGKAVVDNFTGFNYHYNVGIPKAAIIKNAEEAIMSPQRIVGGSVANLAQYPYQAGLVITLVSGGSSVCGGTLVSITKVLTAAHCWWDGANRGRSVTVVLGSVTLFSGGTRIVSTSVTVHPSWDPSSITNDIAIITVPRVTLTNNIQVAALPTGADLNQDFSGLTGIASGYGKTSDSQATFPPTTALHHVSLQIISNSVCQRSFDFSIPSSYICTSGTGSVGTCDGDSGGPLTVLRNNRRTLVGIASFGPSDSCQKSYPSVFTRVTSFTSWIQSNM